MGQVSAKLAGEPTTPKVLNLGLLHPVIDQGKFHTHLWCERTQFQIPPPAVVFITTATVIYSLGHGLHTLTAVPRSTAFHPPWDGKMSICLPAE